MQSITRLMAAEPQDQVVNPGDQMLLDVIGAANKPENTRPAEGIENNTFSRSKPPSRSFPRAHHFWPYEAVPVHPPDPENSK